MKPDIETRITFYDWQESSRPSLNLSDDGKSAILEVGGSRNFIELSGSSHDDLLSVLEGYRDIFTHGVEIVKKQNVTNEFRCS